MNFTITITGEGDELTPAVKALVASLAQANGAVPSLATGGEVTKPETPKKTSRAKPAVEEKAPEADPVEQADVDSETVETVETVETESDEPIPTDVELRAKASEIAKSGKQPAVKALLSEFGVANITALPDDVRAAFMGRLDKL